MEEDVNMRKKDRQSASAAREADFRIVAEDAPVMLWLTNIEGKTIFTNSRWKKFVGASATEPVGGDVWFKSLHPEDRDACLKIFQEAFILRQSFVMEYRLRRDDGQYRYVLDHGEPYINREGKFSGFIGSSTDITDRKNYENQLRLSQLELTQHNREMQLINELNSYLQVCESLEETHSIVAHYARRIFADCTGTLYLFNENHDAVEPVARWGDSQCFSGSVMIQNDCWALRQGKVHVVEGKGDAIICNHVNEDCEHGYVCAPAIAQGEMIGVLCVTLGSGDGNGKVGTTLRPIESRSRLISLAADNLAMALVSLKLREALRNRSVRDPLTSLFNRRYLEETLSRDMSNAKRADRPLSVIMIDIDHFKNYNDTHGHDAGDFVLVELAQIVRSKLRGGDTPCRYGGEELVLIMPGAPKSIAIARAEALRQAIENYEFVYKGKSLSRMTVSLGVSEFPFDGDSSGNLLKSVDTALYRAKELGRNRVVATGEEAASPPLQ